MDTLPERHQHCQPALLLPDICLGDLFLVITDLIGHPLLLCRNGYYFSFGLYRVACGEELGE
jgi:hypothetical protein